MDYEKTYYDEFDYKSKNTIALGRNTAHLIRSFLIAGIFLGVIFGYLFFFTDIEFKHDPRGKDYNIRIEEEYYEGAYGDH